MKPTLPNPDALFLVPLYVQYANLEQVRSLLTKTFDEHKKDFIVGIKSDLNILEALTKVLDEILVKYPQVEQDISIGSKILFYKKLLSTCIELPTDTNQSPTQN